MTALFLATRCRLAKRGERDRDLGQGVGYPTDFLDSKEMHVTREMAELSAAQLEIMNVIWGRGDVTISEVWQELQQRRKIARATVQTVIFRLEEKGWVKHREVGQAFLFSAAVDQDKTRRSLVTNLCDRAFDGSVSGLVWALLDSRSVGKKELERIRELIAKAEEQKTRRSKS